MISFKDDLNKELSNINCSAHSSQIIAKATTKPKRNPYAFIPRIAAAAIVLVLLAGICFAPSLFGTKEQGFVIYAGAEELSSKYYVDLNSNDPNYIKFDFNQILDENAEPTDITRRYLFHSFEKKLDLTVKGENIKYITYKINKGSLTAVIRKNLGTDRSSLGITNSFGEDDSIIKIKYDDQKDTIFSFNFAVPKDNFFSGSPEHYSAIADTGEIVKVTDVVVLENNIFEARPEYNAIAAGYKYDCVPLATEEEIEKLREYIYIDDMIGFYNYQNQIFKRIIDEITIDITITKTDDSTETKTLQLCYTPTEVTSAERANDNHSYTLSNGTLSAKLIKN
ncbi:MAG: hypothetical protein IJ451_03580 [Ruminococcus sp.]|nr:hypothetical protein [Ruminococcus sp.]